MQEPEDEVEPYWCRDCGPEQGHHRYLLGVCAGAAVCRFSDPEALRRPRRTRFTPTYTAQMGHWSEDLVNELAAQVAGDTDRDELRRLLLEAGQEIETLSGRS